MQRVESAREECGKSTAEVVGDIVKSEKSQRTTYSDWLHGHREITFQAAIIVSKRVGLRPPWALFGIGPKTNAEFRLKGSIPEMRTPAFSTRDDLPRKRLSFVHRVNFAPAKMFRDLAAGYGPGSNFEEMEHGYVEGLPGKGFTVAQVRGDSMVATLQDGDFVLLEDFAEGGYELPRIESPAEKTPLDIWKGKTHINDMDIVVVDIDALSEGKTIKRVKYDTRRGKDNWKMLIAADNPLAWQDPWQVEVGDKLTFYGKLVALCEPVK